MADRPPHVQKILDLEYELLKAVDDCGKNHPDDLATVGENWGDGVVDNIIHTGLSSVRWKFDPYAGDD